MAVDNLHKAAVFLRCLPDEQAAALLGRLESGQAAAVAAEMAQLDAVADDEQKAVVLEFASAQNRGDHYGGQYDPAPFDFLHGLDNAALVELLANERSRTIALVLSKLPMAQAAEVLLQFDASRQLEVLRLMAAGGEPDPEAVRAVAQALLSRLHRSESVVPTASGATIAARILAAMPPAVERRLLNALTESEPTLARQIRRAMFGDDVAACDSWESAEAAG